MNMIKVPAHMLAIHENEKPGENVKVDYTAVPKAAMTLRAIDHKLRQQILKLLSESNRLTVTDIYVKLRLEQSVTSQHLAILRRANVVNTEREGQKIFYTINAARIESVSGLVNIFIGKEDSNQLTGKDNE